MYHIRPLAKEDNVAIAKLIRTSLFEFGIDWPGTVYTDPTTDDLFALFQTPQSAYFIATQDGVIVGGCGVFPTPGLPNGCAELVKFYVAKEARGLGVGRGLMDKVIETTKALGYQQLYLESMPELEKAVSIYINAGFTHLNAPMGNSGHYACNVWMLKEL
jgi:putative acetyltransferase